MSWEEGLEIRLALLPDDLKQVEPVVYIDVDPASSSSFLASTPFPKFARWTWSWKTA